MPDKRPRKGFIYHGYSGGRSRRNSDEEQSTIQRYGNDVEPVYGPNGELLGYQDKRNWFENIIKPNYADRLNKEIKLEEADYKKQRSREVAEKREDTEFDTTTKLAYETELGQIKRDFESQDRDDAARKLGKAFNALRSAGLVSSPIIGDDLEVGTTVQAYLGEQGLKEGVGLGYERARVGPVYPVTEGGAQYFEKQGKLLTGGIPNYTTYVQGKEPHTVMENGKVVTKYTDKMGLMPSMIPPRITGIPITNPNPNVSPSPDLNKTYNPTTVPTTLGEVSAQNFGLMPQDKYLNFGQAGPVMSNGSVSAPLLTKPFSHDQNFQQNPYMYQELIKKLKEEQEKAMLQNMYLNFK